MIPMNLKRLRCAAGLSRKEVAERLNVTERAIYNYEKGIRHINLEQVLILSDLFKCSTREIIEAQLNSR